MYNEVHESMTHMTYSITKESNLHQSPNRSAFTYLTSLLYQLPKHSGVTDYITYPERLDCNSPYMTEFYNDYIVGIYMTFISNDRQDIYNQEQIPQNDHDSHQQLSYTIYDLHHQHFSATTHPQYVR